MNQHRPATRAPHGSPEFTARLAANVTPAQKRAFERNGGSGWLRSLIDRQRKHEDVTAKAQALLTSLAEGRADFIDRAIELKTAIRKVQTP